MTAEERQDALERYLAFADSVNRASGPREVRGRDFAATQYFRLADEHLDIVRGSSCFNWVTRKQVTLTQDWSDLLELAGGKPRFRRAWFERQFASRAEGKRLFDLLLEEKFLRPCDDPPARAPVGSSP
jgi:hypothetical protein